MFCDYQYVEEATVSIEPREVLRFQGYRADPAQVREGIQRLVRSQIDHSYRLIQPQAVFRIFPSCLCSGGRIKLEGGREFSIGKVARNWKGLTHLALAICTIGMALEREASRLFSVGEYAAAVMLDSAGSVAVESLADYVNDIVCQQALSKGLTLAPRISPGYRDWALQEQRIVFALLPSDKIEVTLTEKYMMRPRKSVSFAIGIGQGFTIEKGKCRHCGVINCPYRVEGMD